jgi:hypothetical protein
MAPPPSLAEIAGIGSLSRWPELGGRILDGAASRWLVTFSVASEHMFA